MRVIGPRSERKCQCDGSQDPDENIQHHSGCRRPAVTQRPQCQDQRCANPDQRGDHGAHATTTRPS